MTAEISNGAVKPDGIFQVKLITDLFQTAEYLMCSCVVRIVADDGIFYQTVVFPVSFPINGTWQFPPYAIVNVQRTALFPCILTLSIYRIAGEVKSIFADLIHGWEVFSPNTDIPLRIL